LSDQEDKGPDENQAQRRWHGADEGKVGARWWRDDVRAAETSGVNRRKILQGMLIGGGVILAGGLLATWASRDDDTVVENKDSLDVQRAEGWNVGSADQALMYPHRERGDVDGNLIAPDSLKTLGDDLSPRQTRFKPFYVPTLFGVLAQNDVHAQELRAELPPILTPAMQTAFARGRAFAELFKATNAEEKAPGDSAGLADLPGPEAIAFAAGAAEVFEPVFLFDNWPHPLGVVKSHEVLAAAAYFRPVFLRAAEKRAADAPAMFVTDRTRLAPYTDETAQFDNRYMAKVPGAEALAALGVKHVAYVTPQGTEELDDLNEDFVALDKASIDVKVVEMEDFQPDPESTEKTVYYYGGHPYFIPLFWSSYGWYAPYRSYPAAPGHRAPPAGSRGAGYRPTPRPTVFSGRSVGAGRGGVGRAKPSGFGRVSVASSRATGRVVGTAHGRSGSFGRGGSYGS
jgi:hypothetical protein